MTIIFGGAEYSDGVPLNSREFFDKLIESDDFPKTSQINQSVFEDKFDQMTANGDEVLYLAISSKLSGTYNSAKKAAEKYGGKVAVIDTLQVSTGERVLLQYAMYLVKRGKTSLAEIEKKLNEKKVKVQVLALLDTLQYLKKGGRIPPPWLRLRANCCPLSPSCPYWTARCSLWAKRWARKRATTCLVSLWKSAAE